MIEILADVLATEETGKTVSVLKRNYHNDSISPGKCIEAMKIFGRQCFAAGMDKGASLIEEVCTGKKVAPNYDDYINELEETK